jgi:hypothetical protein
MLPSVIGGPAVPMWGGFYAASRWACKCAATADHDIALVIDPALGVVLHNLKAGWPAPAPWVKLALYFFQLKLPPQPCHDDEPCAAQIIQITARLLYCRPFPKCRMTASAANTGRRRALRKVRPVVCDKLRLD